MITIEFIQEGLTFSIDMERAEFNRILPELERNPKITKLFIRYPIGGSTRIF
jgi:hypothetical protein